MELDQDTRSSPPPPPCQLRLRLAGQGLQVPMVDARGTCRCPQVQGVTQAWGWAGGTCVRVSVFGWDLCAGGTCRGGTSRDLQGPEGDLHAQAFDHGGWRSQPLEGRSLKGPGYGGYYQGRRSENTRWPVWGHFKFQTPQPWSTKFCMPKPLTMGGIAAKGRAWWACSAMGGEANTSNRM